MMGGLPTGLYSISLIFYDKYTEERNLLSIVQIFETGFDRVSNTELKNFICNEKSKQSSRYHLLIWTHVYFLLLLCHNSLLHYMCETVLLVLLRNHRLHEDSSLYAVWSATRNYYTLYFITLS